MLKNISLLSIVFVFLFFSCKPDSVDGDDSTSKTWKLSDKYKVAKQSLDTNKDEKSAKLFISEIRSELAKSPDQKQELVLLKEGLATAEAYKLGPTAIGFLMPLVREHESSPKNEEYLAKLASALSDIGKKIPADVLIDAYNSKYPEGEYASVINKKRDNNFESVDTFINKLASNIFENPDKFGVNRVSAQKYVDACEAYALGYPDSEMAPEYLYRAGEMARTVKTYPKALSIYNWINDAYPSYEKSATAMFLKGFMLENEIRDKETARSVYKEFLEKYPENDLVDDVKFLLSNIDKSDEEIMKIIEENGKGK